MLMQFIGGVTSCARFRVREFVLATLTFSSDFNKATSSGGALATTIAAAFTYFVRPVTGASERRVDRRSDMSLAMTCG